MPVSKYDITPANLNIKSSDFKGVRTFAGQIVHLASDNILIWSAITGDPVLSDIEDVNGPKSISTKKDVIEYLKSSFAVGRKAISILQHKMPWNQSSLVGENYPGLILLFMR